MSEHYQRRKIPGIKKHLLDKRNHFLSKYELACENFNTLFRYETLSTSYDVYTEEFIKRFDAIGGIRAIDPFRAKLQLLWKLTGGPNNISSLYKPTTTGLSYILPSSISVGMTDNQRKPNLDVDLVYKPNDNIIKPTENNPYRYSFIESMDFIVYGGLEENGEKGMMIFLLSCFLDPTVSLSGDPRYDEGSVSYQLQNPVGLYDDDFATSYFSINQNGTVAHTQDSALGSGAKLGAEDYLEQFMELVFRPIMVPKAYKENFSDVSTAFLGNGLVLSGGPLKMRSAGVYHDSAFEIPRLVSTQAIETVQSLEGNGNFSGLQFADIDPVYNFMSTNYENKMQSENIAVSKIPNIYREIEKLNRSGNGFVVPGEFLEGLLTGQSQNVFWANYFDKKTNLDKANDKFDHIFVSPEGDYSNNVIDLYKETFPMYNDISFRSHSDKQLFMNVLKSTNAVQDLWDSIIMTLFSSAQTEGKDYDIYKYIGLKTLYSPYSVGRTNGPKGVIEPFQYTCGMDQVALLSEKNLNNLDPFEYQDPFSQHGNTTNKLAVFNFDKWIENYPSKFDVEYPNVTSETKLQTFEDNSSKFISKKNSSDTTGLSKNPLVLLFEGTTSKVQIQTKIEQLARSLMRSYKDVLEGKKAYSEVLFYRIQKKDAGGNTLQNFWLENTPSVDILKYVDTQVKYGVDYDYRIYAYTLVVGTKYRYSSNEISPVSGKRIPSMLDKATGGGYTYLNYENTLENGTPSFKLAQFLKATQQNPVGNSPYYGLDGLKKKHTPYISTRFVQNPSVDIPISGLEAMGIKSNIPETFQLIQDYALSNPEIFNPILNLIYEARDFIDKRKLEIKSIEEFRTTLEEKLFDLDGLYTDYYLTTDLAGNNLIDRDINTYNDFFITFLSGKKSGPTYGFDFSIYLNDESSYANLTGNLSGISNIAFEDMDSISEIKDRLVDINKVLGKYEKQVELWQLFIQNAAEQGDISVAEDTVVAGNFGYLIDALTDRQQQISHIKDLKDQLTDVLISLEANSLAETGALSNIIEIQNITIGAKQNQIDNVYGDDQDKMNAYAGAFKIETSKKRIYTFGDENKRKTRLNIICEPYIKIVETPVFQETVPVISDPPLAPNVEFNAYYKNDNRLLITFDNTIGTERAAQILLPGDDTNAAEKVRRKQDKDYVFANIDFKDTDNLDYVDQKITFKGDDYASSFQVFRKTSFPKSQLDFNSNDLLFVVDASKSASYVDSIAPNTKYYYTFRSIDIHGMPSNPTPVYEIELVSDGGAIFLLIDIVDFSQKNKGKTFKSFERFLQIDPAFLQTLINFDKTDFKGMESAFGVNPQLGVLEESVFDEKKTFKIRLTSKATGKKLDFNVKFKKSVDEQIKIPPIIL